MFDYVARVVLGDLYLFIGGIIAGIMLMSWRFAVNLKNVYIVPETKKTKANMIFISEDKEKLVYVNPKDTWQTLDMFIDYAIWITRKRRGKEDNKTHTLTNEKRVKRIIYFFALLSLIIVVSCVYLIFYVQRH